MFTVLVSNVLHEDVLLVLLDGLDTVRKANNLFLQGSKAIFVGVECCLDALTHVDVHADLSLAEGAHVVLVADLVVPVLRRLEVVLPLGSPRLGDKCVVVWVRHGEADVHIATTKYVEHDVDVLVLGDVLIEALLRLGVDAQNEPTNCDAENSDDEKHNGYLHHL